MTVEHIINKLAQYVSRLYHKQWGRSDLLVIAVVAVLALLTLMVRACRKATV